MRDFLHGLWRGELGLARTFWLLHVAVWLAAFVLFQLLSVSVGMAVRAAVGTPLGALFVLYNVLALVGVVRCAGRKGGSSPAGSESSPITGRQCAS